MEAGLCRDRSGMFTMAVFQVWACSQCYHYLFPQSSPSSNASDPLAMSVLSPFGEAVFPSPSNLTSLRAVCSWLDTGQCSRWQECCTAALHCCQRQISRTLTSTLNVTGYPPPAGSDVTLRTAWQRERADGEGGGGGGSGVFCPQTWDGFSCVDDTPAGSEASIICPAYLDNSLPSARGYRVCTENGTWFSDAVTGQEWTDYTACVPLQGYHLLYVVGTVCNGVSIFFLLPACLIFLAYRSLRKQHRIRIHSNLFLSFLLTSTSLLLWEHLVYRDRLLHQASHSYMHRDSVGCKVLYFVTRYAWMTAFFWMLVEGFHLYRLISRAFQTPVTIWHYYVFGWGVSLIPVSVYGGIRALQQHGSCWVRHAGFLEWLIYGPELLCILSNVFFFVCILRILITEIQCHPNEPSNYRRALKATFLLVPLFGLQLFLVSFTPWPSLTYEIVAKILSSSQGAVVAIIFCFSNNEVHSQIRNTFSTRCRQVAHPIDITVSSHVTAEARASYSLPKTASRHRHSPSGTMDHVDRANYIALQAWGNSHTMA